MTPPPRTSTFTIVYAPPRSPLRKFPRRSRVLQGSRHALQGVAQYHHYFVDMGALDDQRRRQREGVAGVTKHETAVEAVDHEVVAACAGGIRPRRQLDTCDEADGADIDHVRQAAQ